MKRKKWLVSKGDKELASFAAGELGIDSLATYIVTSRGFDDIDKLDEFFDWDAPLTLDPFSIKDMDIAASRVTTAIDNFELICVYGDYDADGVTATALLYSYLESRGANVIRYIPDRIDEGYGLNFNAVDKLNTMGVKLIVTVDNGVTANEEIAYAYSLGMQVVVTDHHKTGAVLPQCEAVVDPHREDCPSVFKEMSGVGVAFKLCCAIEGCDSELLLDEFAEFAALGTIGDVVPVVGENRVIVRRGIKNINENPGIGLSALIEAAGLKDKEFTASSASYTVCPRINAAGRMGSADRALDLLLCDDVDEAEYMANEINAMNVERQKIENEIFQKALAIMATDSDIANARIIVVAGENWHQGVVGIVAAKLTEHFGRPSVVISYHGDEANGSARSIEGFSIFDAIDSVSDILTHYGGHTLAAGVGMNTADIDLFRKKINEYAADKEMPWPVQKIDCRIQPKSVNLDLISSLGVLEPYGAGNPQPCFGIFGVTIEEVTGLSEGKHVRMSVSKNGCRLNAVYFGMQEKRFPFEKGNVVDLAVNLEKNIYNGEARVSVLIRGIRPSVTDDDKVLYSLSVYDRFVRKESLTSEQVRMLIPDRETQVDVFRSIKTAPVKDNYCEQLCVRLGDDGTKLAKYMITVDVMKEMGILTQDENDRISVSETKQKVNLEDSEIMKLLHAMQV